MKSVRKYLFKTASLTMLDFGIALAVLAVIAVVSYRSIDGFQQHANLVEQTRHVLLGIEEALSLLKDAETSQRGYILTSQERYLEPLEAARKKIPEELNTLRALTRDNPRQRFHLEHLRTLVTQKLTEIDEVIHVHDENPASSAAAELVRTGTGKTIMDQIRAVTAQMKDAENNLLRLRAEKSRTSVQQAFFFIIFGNMLGFAILVFAFVRLRLEVREREQAEGKISALNSELEQDAARLASANKELESFSYSVSHDLRSPLRAIDGFSRILQEDYADKLDAEGQRVLDVIRDNSQEMAQLIDDLLAFSRLGRQEIESSEIDMAALAGDAVKELRSTPSAFNKISIKINELSKSWGDRSLLRQVWINLISNAIKYSSKRDNAQIIISGSSAAGEHVYSIRDNGVGFDMKYYDRLFGVFQRLHSAEQFPGTGVGLAIVQRIVARHGGRVWAEGKENEGATFFFALPEKG